MLSEEINKKAEDKGPSNLDLATNELVGAIKKMGWWVGKWKGRGLYEGDELELLPDGTWKSEGTVNVDDGSIWINIADGTLNIKRDPTAGSMEGMTKDYHMTYKFKDMAKV